MSMERSLDSDAVDVVTIHNKDTFPHLAWSAARPGWRPGYMRGQGPTMQAAINDLIVQEEECDATDAKIEARHNRSLGA